MPSVQFFFTRHIDGLMLMNEAFVKESEAIAEAEEVYRIQVEEATALRKAEQRAEMEAKKPQLGLGFEIEGPTPEMKAAQAKQVTRQAVTDTQKREKANHLMQSILKIGSEKPGKIWTRKELVQTSVQRKFAEYLTKEHITTIKALTEGTEAPRIQPHGAKQLRNGKYQLNDESRLTFVFSAKNLSEIITQSS